jgi:cathepsin E
VTGSWGEHEDLSVSISASNNMSRSLGPKNLSLGTLYPDNTSVIPTVTDTLFAQGKIKQNLVAISFEPTNSTLAVNGEVTFGTTDPTKYIGDISYL